MTAQIEVNIEKDGIDVSTSKGSEFVEDVNYRAELSARYTEFEKSLTIQKTLKLYWRSVLWVLYGELVVFGYGIDGVIAAYLVATPRFRQDYGEAFDTGSSTVAYIITANWLSWFNGVSQLAGIIGAWGTGWLADRIGRKYTTLLSCIISIGGVAAQYFSNGSLGILCVGKAINGIPIGMWLVLGPLYASEVAPLGLRGILTATTNIIQFSGVLLFTGVMYELGPRDSTISYKIPLACQWIMPSLIVLTIIFWPESPVWLVRIGKRKAAIKSIERLHGKNSTIDKEGILAQIEETFAVEEQQSLSTKDNKSYLECFEKRQRSRTLICMFIYACQYLSGLIFVLGYQSYFYQLMGFSSKKSFLLGMLNNCFMFIANILSWFLITKLGRRPLIVWGQLLTAVWLFIVGGCSIIGTFPGYIATVSFMFLWGFSYQITLGTVAWTVVGEIPSLRLRARTQGLANIVLCFFQWLIGFIFPYMFNPDAGNLGGKVGFVFGATTFVGFLGTFFFLPETKNRTAAELDALYEKGVNPRNFHKTKLET